MQISNFNEEPGVQILFVDDEAKTRKYFKKALSLHFYVQTCETVTQAQQILEKNPFIGILITDQCMPERKGTDLLKYAKENYPHIVRILTTAFVSADDALNAINESNVFRYITKPWDLSHLTQTLEQAVELFNDQRHSSLSLFKSPIAKKPERIMKEFESACHRWLLYTYYAGDTVENYLWGLNAIDCVYEEHIEKHFSNDVVISLRDQMQSYILKLRSAEHLSSFKDSKISEILDPVKH